MSTQNDEDRAARGGSARYGGGRASGANEPKHAEKKEQRDDWSPRQGGDQTRPGERAAERAARPSGDGGTRR